MTVTRPSDGISVSAFHPLLPPGWYGRAIRNRLTEAVSRWSFSCSSATNRIRKCLFSGVSKWHHAIIILPHVFSLVVENCFSDQFFLHFFLKRVMKLCFVSLGRKSAHFHRHFRAQELPPLLPYAAVIFWWGGGVLPSPLWALLRSANETLLKKTHQGWMLVWHPLETGSSQG